MFVESWPGTVVELDSFPLSRTLPYKSCDICPLHATRLGVCRYNTTNFDLPYLYDRASALGIQKEFHQWGRIRGWWVQLVWFACFFQIRIMQLMAMDSMSLVFAVPQLFGRRCIILAFVHCSPPH